MFCFSLSFSLGFVNFYMLKEQTEDEIVRAYFYSKTKNVFNTLLNTLFYIPKVRTFDM